MHIWRFAIFGGTCCEVAALLARALGLSSIPHLTRLDIDEDSSIDLTQDAWAQ